MAPDDNNYSSTEAFLDRLHASGVRVFLKDTRVHVQAAPGTLSPELKEALRARRDDIAKHLLQAVDPIAGLTVQSERKAPLVPWQRGFWLLHLRSDADLAVLHNACLLTIRGRLDVGLLDRALAALSGEQEILRARFLASGDGDALQIDQGQGPRLEPLSLEHRQPGETVGDFARRRLADLLGRRFDLAREAPMRLELVSDAGDEHWLLLAAHHVAIDGWSLGLLLSRLFQLYDAGGQRTEPPNPVSFFDAAHFFHAHWRSPEAQRAVADAGAEVSRLPLCQALATDFRRGAVGTAAQGAVRFAVSRELTVRLLALADQHGGGLYAALIACLALLYACLTGRDRLVTMSPVANRGLSPLLEGMAGCLANGILVAPRVCASMSLRTALAAVVAQAMPRLENQGLPFDDILDAAAPPRLPATYPAAQIFLALQDAAAVPRSKTLAIELADLPPLGRQDLLIEFRHGSAGGLDGRVNYDARLFSRATAEAFTTALVALTEAAAAAPDRAAVSLPLGAPVEPTALSRPDVGAGRRPAFCLNARQRSLAARLASVARPGETAAWVGPLGLERLAVLQAAEAAGVRLLALSPKISAGDAASVIAEAGATVFIAAGDLKGVQDGDDASAVPACAKGLRRVGRDSAPLPADPKPGRLVLGHGGLITVPAAEVERRRAAAARALAALDIGPDQPITLDLADGSDEVIDLLDLLARRGHRFLPSTCDPEPAALLLAARWPGPRGSGRCILVNHFSGHAPCLLGTPEGGLFACCRGFEDAAGFQPATPLRDGVRVLTPHGTEVPEGLPGELTFAPPDGSGSARMPRSPAAKRLAGGALALRSDPLAAPSGWVNGRYLDFAAGAAALIERAGLADAALDLRRGPEGLELIAWVAPRGPGTAEMVSQAVRQALGGLAQPDHIVRVNALPRDLDGRLDRHRLSLMPVAAVTTLASVPGRRDVQIEARPPQTSPEPRHLATLLPPTGQSGIRALPTFAHADGWQGDGGPVAGAPPALATGPAVDATYPLDGWSPLRWLDRAAGTDGVLRTLEFDGVETETAYRDLAARAGRIARGLRRAGYRPGSIVLLAPRRCLDMVAGFLGATAAGVTVAPVPHPRDWRRGDAGFDRLVHIARLTQAAAVIVEEQVSLTDAPDLAVEILTLDALAAGPDLASAHAWRADETLLISFTSGSTGAPKGVPLSARNIWAETRALGPALGIGPGEVALNFTGLDHVASLVGYCGSALFARAKLAIFSVERFVADPDALVDRLAAWQVAHTWAPDFAWRLLAERLDAREPGDLDLASLRTVCSGGECPLDATFAKLTSALVRHRGVGVRLVTSWGMAETTSFFTLSAPWDGTRAHHVENGVIDSGAPLPGNEIRVVDAGGRLVSDGQVGQFEVRGDQVFDRYILLGDDGAKTRVSPLTPDGWLKTGDLALISNGRAVLLGREKDVLILNGQNIAQAAIEDAIGQIDGVEAGFTAAIATRDATSGDSVLVVFFCPSSQPEGSGGLAKLVRRLSGTVAARYGVTPDYVLPVAKSDVPKTGLGKIQRTRLRKAFEAGAFRRLVHRMDLLLDTKRCLPSVFRSWHQVPLEIALPARLAKPRVLLIDDGLGMAHALDRALSRLDARTLRLPASALDGDAATAFLRHGAIVVDVPAALDHDDERAGEMLRRARLASHLCKQHDRPLRFLWIERNDRTGQSWALGRTGAAALRHEVKGATFQSLKPVSLVSDAEIDALAQAILGAVGHCDTGLELDRDHRLWTSRLSPLAEPDPKAWATFPNGATLLVAGGLGAVGHVLLPHLLAWTDWRLVVVSRRPRDAARQALKGWALAPKDAARIDLRQADAEDAAAIARCCADLRVDGVVNLTGRAEPSPLAQLSEAQLQTMVGARVRVAAALDQAFAGREIPIAHVTSAYADLGGHDYLAYCVANAAHQHWIARQTGRAPRHVDVTCGFWMPIGGPSDLTDHQARLGYTAIDGPTGAAGLIQALLGPHRRLVIGLHAGGTETRPHALSRPRPIDAIVARPRGSRLDAGTREALRARAERYGVSLGFENQAGGAAEVALNPAERQVLTLWRTVLGSDAEILPDTNFFDTGGTSLLAARLHLLLKQTFGGPKELLALFSHTTVRAQARLLAAPDGTSQGADIEAGPPPRSEIKGKHRTGRGMAERRRAARTTPAHKETLS